MPIGVIGVIYESRPNVTVDTAALCLKAGNATVLRGGSEAFRSNTALAGAFAAGLAGAGLPGACVQLIPFTDREAVPALCGMTGLVDLVIPRGGHSLVKAVVESARVPVIKHYHGICHGYVDAAADFDMAERIVVNAKCSRPGVCNAMETLLVDSRIAPTLVPRLAATLAGKGVELRADARALPLAPGAKAASPEDFDTEHLDLILNLAVVDGVDGALAHIAQAFLPDIPTRSSRATRRRRRSSSTPWTARASIGTPRPGSPTAANSASAPRSASRPTSSMRAVRWA